MPDGDRARSGRPAPDEGGRRRGPPPASTPKTNTYSYTGKPALGLVSVSTDGGEELALT
jgi:hypothetical protein